MMPKSDITNKLIVRKSAAGPKYTNEEATEEAPTESEAVEEVDEYALAQQRAVKKEKETTIQIDGKLVCVSQINSARECLCTAFTEHYDFYGGGYQDGTIKLFRTDTHENTYKLTDQEVTRAPVTAMHHRPVSKNYPVTNTFTCTYANGCVKCWNYNFNQCIYTIREKRQTYGLTYHPRLPKFVTYGDDMNIYMYDEESRTQERILTKSDNPSLQDGHTSRVYAGCFNPRSNHELCTGGWDNVVQFWDLRQPHAIRHLTGIHMCGEGIDINQRGTEMITCAFQKQKIMQLWDYGSGKLIQTIDPDVYPSKLYCGRYIGKDFFVCGGTDPNILRIVDLTNFVSKAVITNFATAVYAVDLGPPVKVKKSPADRGKGGDLSGIPRLSVAAGKILYQIEPY